MLCYNTEFVNCMHEKYSIWNMEGKNLFVRVFYITYQINKMVNITLVCDVIVSLHICLGPVVLIKAGLVA